MHLAMMHFLQIPNKKAPFCAGLFLLETGLEIKDHHAKLRLV